MKTMVAEVIPKAEDFMARAKAEGKPFFVWLNASRMHLYTRLKTENATWRRSTRPRPTCTAAV